MGYSDDLCTGGTVEAESEYGVGYEAELAFDDSESTFWATAAVGASPSWIGYKLTSQAAVTKLRIKQWSTWGTSHIVLQGSNDATHDEDWDSKSWSDVYETEEAAGDGSWEEYEFSNGTLYLYYRLVGYRNVWGIYEIELMEGLFEEFFSEGFDLGMTFDVGLTPKQFSEQVKLSMQIIANLQYDPNSDFSPLNKKRRKAFPTGADLSVSRNKLKETYSCCDADDYFFQFGYNGDLISPDDSYVIEVWGGCPDYTWDFSGDHTGYSWAEATTTVPYNTLVVSAEAAEDDLIILKVTDNCSEEITCYANTLVEQVATPIISPYDGKAITDDTSCTIACGTDGATIWYSLNSAAYVEYTAAFTVDPGDQVEAYATKSGMKPSEIATTFYHGIKYITVVAPLQDSGPPYESSQFTPAAWSEDSDSTLDGPTIYFDDSVLELGYHTTKQHVCVWIPDIELPNLDFDAFYFYMTVFAAHGYVAYDTDLEFKVRLCKNMAIAMPSTEWDVDWDNEDFTSEVSWTETYNVNTEPPEGTLLGVDIKDAFDEIVNSGYFINGGNLLITVDILAQDFSEMPPGFYMYIDFYSATCLGANQTAYEDLPYLYIKYTM